MMTEVQARAALAAFDGVGGLEAWIAEQRWEAIPRRLAGAGAASKLAFPDRARCRRAPHRHVRAGVSRRRGSYRRARGVVRKARAVSGRCAKCAHENCCGRYTICIAVNLQGY